MADGLAVERSVEPPPVNQQLSGRHLYKETNEEVMRAIAKVALFHDRCVRISGDAASRDPGFAAVEMQRRQALLELAGVPALSPKAYSAKLEMLTKLLPWYGREDAELFDCFVKLSIEAANLLLRYEALEPVLSKPVSETSNSRSVRWFFGIAAAVPSLLSGRWESGGG